MTPATSAQPDAARQPELSAYLAAHANDQLGPEAGPWLAGLTDTVSKLTSTWGLRSVRAHPDANRSFVATATHPRHGACYLKVELPGAPNAPAALAVWAADSNAPTVLAADHSQSAYLVAAFPGRPVQPGSAQALDVTAAVARAITAGQGRTTPLGLVPLSVTGPRWAATARERLARLDGPAPYDPALLDADADVLARLNTGGLLHGDLVPANVLVAGPRIVLIDPEPMTGPAERDLANWCLRASGGRDVPAYLRAVKAAVDIDEELLSRLVSFSARTYTAYLLNRGLAPPAGVLDLTSAR